MSKFLVVFTTAPTEREARIIARKLIEEDLAKCVSIAPIRSFFKWKGEMNDVSEYLLIVKATLKNYKKLEEKIKELHSYEVPELVGFPIVKGSKEYLKWLEGSG